MARQDSPCGYTGADDFRVDGPDGYDYPGAATFRSDGTPHTRQSRSRSQTPCCDTKTRRVVRSTVSVAASGLQRDRRSTQPILPLPLRHRESRSPDNQALQQHRALARKGRPCGSQADTESSASAPSSKCTSTKGVTAMAPSFGLVQPTPERHRDHFPEGVRLLDPDTPDEVHKCFGSRWIAVQELAVAE